MPVNIIIDTDPGIDDAVAIMLAAASPEVNLLGLTAVAGNVGLHHTAPNAAALADLLRLDIPIGRGASGPLWRRDTMPAEEVHGTNGFGGYQLPASSRLLEPALPLLARLVEEADGPVVLVAIGPLTNVAMFMNLYPDLARRLERVVLMGGGTLDAPGNVTAASEFNIYYDPDAAAKVFDFGIPLTMVGLNVTLKTALGPADFAPLAASGGPIAHMVGNMLGHYLEPEYEGEGGLSAQHDSLALAAAFAPDIITTRRCHVDVENTGRITSGMTLVDLRKRPGHEPNCDVAVGVDFDRFRGLLVGRLTELDERLKELS